MIVMIKQTPIMRTINQSSIFAIHYTCVSEHPSLLEKQIPSNMHLTPILYRKGDLFKLIAKLKFWVFLKKSVNLTKF